jgi:uncharacterized GH25 family protein
MTFARRLLIAAAAASLMIGAAHADRAWVPPSASVVSGDKAWVTLDGAISNSLFFPDHRPMQVEAIAIKALDGSSVKLANATVGQYRTTFDHELKQQGTCRIAQASSGLSASYKGGAGTKRWRGAMQEHVAQGIDKKPGVELAATSRRVETFVTNGAPTPLKAAGKDLELGGATHPNDLHSGEEASLMMTENGKPAANAEVTIIQAGERYRDEPGELKLTTGADGSLKVALENAGMYWLEAGSTVTTTIEGKALKSQST